MEMVLRGDGDNAKDQTLGIRGTQGSGIQAKVDPDSGIYSFGASEADGHQLLRGGGESDPQPSSCGSGSERIGGIISQLILECREHVNTLEGQLASQKSHLEKLEDLFQQFIDAQNE
jgi:hypothetical protein